ncbi:AAA family ATPase [Candidatus Minimicrobia vallesae]|uniref:AAA family ATPase n=1 Tax=Candidatus Minimicrobia vallesae TaxID=2841264 RepID=UPI0022B7E936|nr:hypothetical protein [Candidatus Minimicrobia vallesae]
MRREDIGLAGNGALSLAIATFEAVERVGLPEAKSTICSVVLLRWLVVGSRVKLLILMHGAFELARKYPNSPVPLRLRNAPTKLMKGFGPITGATNGELAFSMTKDFYQRKLRMWYNWHINILKRRS